MLRPRGEAGVLRLGPRAYDLRLRGPEVSAASEGAVTEAAWRAFHGPLRSFASRQVATAADAEDIVQKVFLNLHRSLPRLRRTDRIGAWLYQAARNAIVDHYRAPARRRERAKGDAWDLEAVGGATPGADAVPSSRAQAARCLHGMMGRLADGDRRAIDSVDLRGMTQRAAAAAEGLTLSGMKTRVQRARRRLKAALLECCRVVLDAREAVIGCSAQSPAGTARENRCPGKGCGR